MTTTTATTARPRRTRGRHVLGRICLVLPALAIAAFGGQQLITGWTDNRVGGAHHVHDLAWGALEAILLLVALVALIHRPGRRPAASLQALAVVAALLVTMALVVAPDPFTIVLAVLICAGVALTAGGSLPGETRRSWPLMAITALASVPLLGWALAAAGNQRANGDGHAELLGYTGVTAFALALLAVLAVAALRPPAWRVPAGSAAVGAAVVGTAGLLWPDKRVQPWRNGRGGPARTRGGHHGSGGVLPRLDLNQ